MTILKSKISAYILKVVFFILLSGTIIFICYSIIAGCTNKTDIEISYLIFDNYEGGSRHYCDLVNKSISEQDEQAIKKLSSLRFSGIVSHDHGNVLVEIVFKIGEDKYLKSIQDLSSEEKYWIKQAFIGGIMVGSDDYNSKSLDELFPKIHNYLKNYKYQSGRSF